MADSTLRYWQCPNSSCGTFVRCDLLTCPKCQTQQGFSVPNRERDPSSMVDGKGSHEPTELTASSRSTSDIQGNSNQPQRDEHSLVRPDQNRPVQYAGGEEQHSAEIRHRTEQLREARQLPQQTPQQCACGHSLEKITNFCPHCGTQLNALPQASDRPFEGNATNTQPQVHPPKCYFCATLLDTNKQCPQCRRPQPKPLGPPCIHGCGARLIHPNATVCGRCGKPQRRTPSRPDIKPKPPTNLNLGLAAGYGYPNNTSEGGRHQNTPQFGQHAEVSTVIHPQQVQLPGLPYSVSQSTKDGASVEATPKTDSSSIDEGNSSGSLTIADKTTTLGHPATALKVDQPCTERGIQKPIEETGHSTSSCITRLQGTDRHPLQTEDKLKRNVGGKPDVEGDVDTLKTRINNSKHVDSGQTLLSSESSCSTAEKVNVTGSGISEALPDHMMHPTTTASEVTTTSVGISTTTSTNTSTTTSTITPSPLAVESTGDRPSTLPLVSIINFGVGCDPALHRYV